MASLGTKQTLQERRQTGDRRRSTSGRRSNDQRLENPDQAASEQVVAIVAAIILAPRLQALELRDSVPIRNLIQQSVSLAKVVLQKATVELARDLSSPPSRS